ncbi:hypothetical protein EV426DRAFT_704948 [Tirmania nivea]|nr:hypothetical protein EV426DRAFT_704948 [Tirmania nivea]
MGGLAEGGEDCGRRRLAGVSRRRAGGEWGGLVGGWASSGRGGLAGWEGRTSGSWSWEGWRGVVRTGRGGGLVVGGVGWWW